MRALFHAVAVREGLKCKKHDSKMVTCSVEGCITDTKARGLSGPHGGQKWDLLVQQVHHCRRSQGPVRQGRCRRTVQVTYIIYYLSFYIECKGLVLRALAPKQFYTA